MNTPVREGETIEGSRTRRNRPYPVLKCSKEFRSSESPAVRVLPIPPSRSLHPSLVHPAVYTFLAEVEAQS